MTYAQQSVVATFESFALPADSFLNGEEELNNSSWKGFENGNLLFQNFYDTSFGGFWSEGFAISTMRDSITDGFTNLYSSITASGYMSPTYAIGQNNAWIYNNDTTTQMAEGVYVTNSTYAALSMKNGDIFAKKFGGTSGNDSDFFILHFVGFFEGVKSDTVRFYLADYRFNNNANDYIVNSWTWVDLTSIGRFDSIQLVLTSSDNGPFGMNTPSFYALDDFTVKPAPVTAVKQVSKANIKLTVYPNPASNVLFIEGNQTENIYITDMQGKIVMNSSSTTIDISGLIAGMYLVHAVVDGQTVNTKFIKNN
jgi:hypothetical protein